MLVLVTPLEHYRRLGADLPFGDPARAHGTPFEGYYWRFAHPGSGVVAVALCAVCRDARGSWGMATLAAHPGGFARTAIAPAASADACGFGARIGDALRGDASAVAVDLGADARLDVTLHDVVAWPRRAFGALGPAHAVPGLAQYWHPAVLSARVRGELRAGGRVLALDDAVGYAEKNWGGGFPGRWWWGQAGTFPGADVSVAFAGGRLGLLGAGLAPTAVALRLGHDVIALAPPAHRTRVALGDGAWRLRTQGARWRVELEGDAAGNAAHALDVPVPGERRSADRARQHLAARLTLTVYAGRRLRFRGEAPLAGLELGAGDRRALSGRSPGAPRG
jgi:Tocopherol cyclase